MNLYGYVILSVVIVSLVSFVGILSLFLRHKIMDKTLLLLVSLSAGTLFGGAFLHLLPEAVEKSGFTVQVSLLILAGVLVFFVLEKFIHWRHCHIHPEQGVHKHQEFKLNHIATLNLTADALHNFLDGLVIAGSYLVSIPAGIATTIAVIFHEVPQEMADFGVLLHSGLSKTKALLLNFASGALAILGAILGLFWSAKSGVFIDFILPFAAGGFIYIAGSNLIPELQKECGLRNSFWHFLAMLTGIIIMVLLLYLG